MTQTMQYGYPGGAGDQYYRHSGQVTFAGPLLALAVGGAVAAALAFAYAYADLYIPLIYLNLLLCLGFGAALGAVPGVILRATKVRNVPVSLAVAGLVAVAGFYTCWVVWECAVLDRYDGPPGRPFSYAQLEARPMAVLRLAQAIDENGTWSLGHSRGENVSGTFLWLIWAGEAATILGTALVVARKFAGELPFCERCERWCEKPVAVARVNPGDAAQLRRTMEAGDYAYLRSLVPAGQIGTTWWRLDHHRCAGCDQLHTITVTEVRQQTDRRGRTTEKSKVLVHRLLATPEQVQSLRAALTPPQPVAPPVPAAVGGGGRGAAQ